MAVLGMLSVAYTSYGQDALTDNHTITITIPSVAILDIEPSGSKDITVAFAVPTEAGDSLLAPSDNNTLWLNYSTILNGTVTSRKVTAHISTGYVANSGLAVGLEAGAATGTGVGTLGVPVAGPVTLTGTAQDIVTGIGSAYTQTGASQGHQLTYSFKTVPGSYSQLTAGNTILTVTYTMTDV